jgi:hypothetical protein
MAPLLKAGGRRYRNHLAKAELASLAALLIVAVAFAGVAAFQVWAHPANQLFGLTATAALFFGYTFLIGLFPVALFGAPLYAKLAYMGKASWLSALTIGIVPGLLFLFVAKDLALYSIVGGVVISLATHLVCRVGSNNSFKPNPLRSSKTPSEFSGGSA